MKKLFLALMLLIGTIQIYAAKEFPYYYDVLKIPPTATSAEIKSAYRALALQYHPDKTTDPGAPAKLRELNEAWDVLRDEEKKKKYDRGEEYEEKWKPETGLSAEEEALKKYYKTFMRQLHQGSDVEILRKHCKEKRVVSSTDAEIHRICKIVLPILEKIESVQPLTLKDKKTVFADPVAHEYYQLKRDEALERVDDKLSKGIAAHEEPRYFYLDLITDLEPFTPATSAKILMLYIETIDAYIRMKNFAMAQQIAQRAQIKVMQLAQEIHNLGTHFPKFDTARTKLQISIDSIEKAEKGHVPPHHKRPEPAPSSSASSSSSSTSSATGPGTSTVEPVKPGLSRAEAIARERARRAEAMKNIFGS
jgi:hypothetical protein